MVGAHIYTSLACLGPEEQSLAQGELLGLSLLLDDVLQMSDLVVNNSSQRADGVDTHIQVVPSNAHVSHAQTPIGSSRRASIVTRQTSSEPMRGSGLLRTKQSSTPDVHTLTSLHLLVPPLEGMQLMKQFLIKSLQLEVLKMEWGTKMLRLHSVMTQGHAELLENVYRDKVLSWVRKTVAKQQLRDLARMQAESVSLSSLPPKQP